MSVLICAVLSAAAAWALTGFMRRCATSDAPILHRWWHVVVAAALGALAGLASTWAEMAAFAVLAVASGLLTVIDLAEERLPDVIVLPMIGLTAVLLTIAAWTSGNWGALGRAGLAALALFVLYFVMMVFSPDLGFGDVKLAAVAGTFGGWFSWGAVLLGFGAGWVAFALTSIVLLAARKRKLKGSLSFGPFLILGSVLGVLWAGALLTW